MENRSPPLYKRIIPLVCTFAVLISMMALPAMADEVNAYSYNLLDYATPNDSGQFNVTVNDGTVINFKMPLPTVISYVDILFNNNGQIITGMTITHGTSTAELTIEKIDGRLYRAYGELAVTTDDEVALTIQTNNTGYLVFNRFEIALQATNVVSRVPYSIFGNDEFSNYSYDSDGRTWRYDLYYSATDPGAYTYLAEFSVSDWRKYDALTFSFDTEIYELDSVAVDINGVSVPFEVSEVGLGTANLYGRFAVLVDLANADRTLSGNVVVRFRGIYVPQALEQYVQCNYVNGFVSQTEISPWFVWFSNLGGWIQAQTTAITTRIATWGKNITDTTALLSETVKTWGQNIVDALGGNADTSEMESEVGAIKGQMQDASDTMADFTRPPVEDVFTEVDLDIGTGTPFSDMMAAFFENDFVVSIITGSLAFTLFGILVG